jgi:pimeloyl-ACP methyl ester carboxylesterase
MTGAGERSHLAGPEVDLSVQITDILKVLEFEDLREVVLVSHSYSGMVATAVAEKASARLSRLVYLDAFIPGHGQALADLVGPAGARFKSMPDWRIPPFPMERIGILKEADVKWVLPRLVPQPLKTFVEPVQLGNPAASSIPRTFIRCTEPAMPEFEHFERQARDKGWTIHHLRAGHCAMVTAPAELAKLLLDLPVA